jgi:hypothetical protein
MNRPLLFAAASIVVLFFSLGGPSSAATGGEQTGRGNVPMEGDLTIRGQGEESKGLLLGAEIGNRTEKGMKISLYVLQAAAPGPPRPDLPNHLFSVVLEDLKEKRIIKDAALSGTISSGGKKQELSFKFARPVSYQAGARLKNLGLHNIEIAYKRGQEQGRASFKYKVMPAPPAHDDEQG